MVEVNTTHWRCRRHHALERTLWQAVKSHLKTLFNDCLIETFWYMPPQTS
jgi:hypothetical protein